MTYIFDISDKNIGYALIQFASKLDIDTCQSFISSLLTAKAGSGKFELTLDSGSAYESLLKYFLLEFCPDNEYVRNWKILTPIEDLSREQLISRKAQGLLNIQRSIEATLIFARDLGYGVFVSNGLATWGRATSFAGDDKFYLLHEKYSDLLSAPNWHWNLSVAKWCVESALKLDGDLVELGVFKGHTTAFVADYVDFSKQAKNWYLYDTFTGIPAEDMNNSSWADKNTAAYSNFSYEEVADRFKHYPNIHVIQGRVPDVFKETPPPSRISFLHIDMNSAKAEIAALEYIFDAVIPGGIILFDDYGWKVCDEQHQAINKWAKEKALSILELPTGQGLLVAPASK
jgi:hypothetical protein